MVGARTCDPAAPGCDPQSRSRVADVVTSVAFHPIFPGMRKLLRVLLWTAAVLGLLVIVVAVTAIWFVRRPFPDYRGTVTLGALEAPVEVLRDEMGVPHIWAENDADMYFAQGYVHAQDRFWQMEFSRRVGAGRLSEILGEDLVDSDRYLRTLGFARVAEEEYRNLTEPYRSYLEAYSAGVNAYIRDREPGQLGLEFSLLGLTGTEVTVEPWTPVHSLTWGKVMADSLSAGLTAEFGNIAFRRFGGETLHEVFRPPYREDFPYIVTLQEIAAFRERAGLDPITALLGENADGSPAGRYRVGGSGIGSNNWVVGGSRTESGLPLLANDMHLGVQMPSIWYEVGLHVEPGHGASHGVRGYSFPGVPGVIAGQNERIAWGITNLPGDARDSHLLEIHPEDPDRYRVDGEWRRMEVTHELIPVAGEEEAEAHRVRRTIYGPVITDLPQYDEWFSYEVQGDAPRTASAGSAGAEAAAPLRTRELALRWSALTPETLLPAVMELNRAENYEEFRSALSHWGSPGQNFVYADREGNIAYQGTGTFPARSLDEGALPDEDGEPPAPPQPFERIPAVRNPEKDYIATANQPVVPPEYPYPLGGDSFAGGRRAARIAERIETLPGPATVEDMQSIHGDIYSIAASELVPFYLDLDPEHSLETWERYTRSRRPSIAGTEDGAGSDAASTAEEALREDLELAEELVPAALDILADWDYRMTVDSAGAAIYAFAFNSLVAQILRDEVPPQEWPIGGPGYHQSILYHLLQDPAHPVWDDRVSPEREEAATILRRSLVAGLLDLAEAQGEEPEEWRWGDAHHISFENQSLGQSGIGLVERILNRGSFELPGGPTTVNVAHWRASEPFEVTVIASQRAVYDLEDPSRSVFTHTTGQSGHPFHRHYADMIENWQKVRYHPANWTYEEAREAAGRRRLTLEPSP
mgnify:CR=1 FL=1